MKKVRVSLKFSNELGAEVLRISGVADLDSSLAIVLHFERWWKKGSLLVHLDQLEYFDQGAALALASCRERVVAEGKEFVILYQGNDNLTKKVLQWSGLQQYMCSNLEQAKSIIAK